MDAGVAAELAGLRGQVASLEAKLDRMALGAAPDRTLGTSPPGPSPFGASPPASFGLGTSPPAASLGPPRTSAMPIAVSRKSFGEGERDRFKAWAAQRQSPEQSPRLAPVDDGVSSLYPSRIVLTTYPGQVGIDPVPLKWIARNAEERGPVVVSRHPSTLKKRNAIGAHGGCALQLVRR